MTQDVVFLFRPRLRRAGSKIMRCDQLAGIGDRFLADRYAFSVQVLLRLESDGARSDFAAKLTGKIVILLKGTASVPGDAGMCFIPDDHIAPRRSALFMARSVLNEVRDGRSAC
jgi:hypothetical protein